MAASDHRLLTFLGSFDPRIPARRVRDRLTRVLQIQLAGLREQTEQQLARYAEALEQQREQTEALSRAMEQRLQEIRAETVRAQEDAARAAAHALREVRESGEAAQARTLRWLNALDICVAAMYARPEPLFAHPSGDGTVPRVSVVMPVWNRAGMTAEAVRSVQAQRFRSWELIIVDDGSTDGTVAILEPLLTDSRIRLEQIAHGGVCRARNHALSQARGDLIAYLDSDNLMLPEHLAVAVAAFDADPELDVAYGVLISQGGTVNGQHVLSDPFDRSKLLQDNAIDLNVVVHRRRLFEQYGGFDEALVRLVDWDLILRYTRHAPALPLPVASVLYRTARDDRLSHRVALGPSYLRIREKWLPQSAIRPRVLYVVWHYPHLTETYVEAEIKAALAMGVEIQVWSDEDVAATYQAAAPWRRGSLDAAIEAFRPHVLHLHWLGFASGQALGEATRNLPVTVRAHGFDTTAERLAAVLAKPGVERVYVFPHQRRLASPDDVRIRTMNTAFDAALFAPGTLKDRRLVVRTGAALPSKDYATFLELARRVSTHRFILVLGTAHQREEYVDAIRSMAADMGSPAELRFNASHEACAALLAEAGIYLHTATPPGAPGHTPIGMPVSIAEGMASGCYVLVRDLPELASFVDRAGAAYRDVDHAEALIRDTLAWDDATWLRMSNHAIDRGFVLCANTVVVAPLVQDWRDMATRQASARHA